MSSRSASAGSARVAAICSSSSAMRLVAVAATSARRAAFQRERTFSSGKYVVTAGVGSAAANAPAAASAPAAAARARGRAAGAGAAAEGVAERVVDEPAQAAAHRGVGDAEDGLEDDLHGQVLGLREDLHRRRPGRQPSSSASMSRCMQVGVRPHAVAVERREQELAALEVLGRLEQQDRAVADERLEDLVGVALASSGAPVSRRRIASRSVVRTKGGYVPGPDREGRRRSARGRRG